MSQFNTATTAVYHVGSLLGKKTSHLPALACSARPEKGEPIIPVSLGLYYMQLSWLAIYPRNIRSQYRHLPIIQGNTHASE
jgi:hypothetical protein